MTDEIKLIQKRLEAAKVRAREIAARTKPRFVIHTPAQRREGRVYRHTAAENTLRKLERERNPLYAEQERLLRTWGE